MPYRFLQHETVAVSVRRVADEQIEPALQRLGGSDDLEETVHDVRKRCKKLRGLVRMVRPPLGDTYHSANRIFRDAARILAPYRDAHALGETVQALVDTHGHLLPDGDIDSVLGRIHADASGATRRLEADRGPFEEAAAMLRRGGDLIEEASLDDGFDTVAGGLAKTYKRTRNRMHDAAEAPSPAVFHEWRKRVKYHWYHVRLLRESAPSVLTPLGSRLHDLSDALGDAHDLAVFVDTAGEWHDVDTGEVEAAVRIADGVRVELERRSISLGQRLLAETPGRLVDRLEAYWTAWHDHGEEAKAGEIADLWAS